MLKLLHFSLICGLCFSLAAHAWPMPNWGLSALERPADFSASDYDFEGTVRLNNCSGSLIRFETSLDSDPAVVLTNGHCFEGGFTAPGKFVVGQPSDREFDLLNSAARSAGHVNATQVIYSTMTDTDVTLYKLNETYSEIQNNYGVHPLTLASGHPTVGTPIEVVSGYWSRGYSCNVEFFANTLREDTWTFRDSLRYSRPGCAVIGGTSGSPVVQSGSRTVIAINNTINQSGRKCTEDNPCEVDVGGKITFQQGYGYAQETYNIYGCLDANRNFDLATPGCRLPR